MHIDSSASTGVAQAENQAVNIDLWLPRNEAGWSAETSVMVCISCLLGVWMTWLVRQLFLLSIAYYVQVGALWLSFTIADHD